jgi:hypothetical protein
MPPAPQTRDPKAADPEGMMSDEDVRAAEARCEGLFSCTAVDFESMPAATAADLFLLAKAYHEQVCDLRMVVAKGLGLFRNMAGETTVTVKDALAICSFMELARASLNLEG